MEEGRTGRRASKWNHLKDFLCFKSLSCLCGNSIPTNHHRTLIDNEDEEEEFYYSSSGSYQDHSQVQLVQPTSTNYTTSLHEEIPTRDLNCLRLSHQNLSEEMNLASALAAVRQIRAGSGNKKKSLMRLLEEKEREEKEKNSRNCNLNEEEDGVGSFCCVCMGRKKGAAFIPCGHTFCRVCARELWMSRGACPLCNQNVTEILDIF